MEALEVIKRIAITVSIVTLVATIIIVVYKVRQTLYIWKIVMDDPDEYDPSKAKKEWK